MNWQPSASRESLALRAELMRRTRAFFDARGVLEVDTPVLASGAPTEAHIHSIETRADALGRRFLQTSPEFPMKRLLAAGSGDIWQSCKVFRAEERGRLHHPEFTLLEWYRAGFDERALAAEVVELLRALLDGYRVLGPARSIPYAELIDPALPEPERDRKLATEIGPALGEDGPVIVTGWPADQASLARVRDDGTAARFEVFVDGIELANGYHELADAGEQRARFERDNVRRVDLGLPEIPLDERLLAALEAGLPDCAGVAVGFDRVVMLAAGADSLAEVLAFPDES